MTFKIGVMLDPVLAGLFLLEYGHIFSLGIFIDLPMQFARFTNETLLRPGLEAELSAKNLKKLKY